MGYRHRFISCGFVPNVKQIPNWFFVKYDKYIRFDIGQWTSRGEFKRYGIFHELEEDIQKVLTEINHYFDIRLIFFADEGGYVNPDISYVWISKTRIKEKKWSDKPKAKDDPMPAVTGSDAFIALCKRINDEKETLFVNKKDYSDLLCLDLLVSGVSQDNGIFVRVTPEGQGRGFVINLDDYLED